MQHPERGRYLLLALGMLALVFGLWSGLLRIGWRLPRGHAGLAMQHGPLMVCGFLGTVIALERAVALRRLWAYAVPLLVGVGGLLLVAGADARVGALLFTLGSLGLVGLYAVLLRLQADGFLQVMALGAVAWLVGNALWLAGTPVFAVVPWWMGFLVLTIAGERLELSRMLGHDARVQHLFMGITAVFLTALAATFFTPDAGTRGMGVALLAMAAWLVRYDVARYTVRQTGLTRFIAVCLLAGYGWMGVAGVLALAVGGVTAGPFYDALLHAVFVGFVFSMIFGHAPIIFPAVLGVPPFYRPVLYAPLALLHASLALRIVADVAGYMALRRWGGLLGAAAIALFLASVGYSMWASRSRAAAPPVSF